MSGNISGQPCGSTTASRQPRGRAFRRLFPRTAVANWRTHLQGVGYPGPVEKGRPLHF